MSESNNHEEELNQCVADLSFHHYFTPYSLITKWLITSPRPSRDPGMSGGTGGKSEAYNLQENTEDGGVSSDGRTQRGSASDQRYVDHIYSSSFVPLPDKHRSVTAALITE